MTAGEKTTTYDVNENGQMVFGAFGIIVPGIELESAGWINFGLDVAPGTSAYAIVNHVNNGDYMCMRGAVPHQICELMGAITDLSIDLHGDRASPVLPSTALFIVHERLLSALKAASLVGLSAVKASSDREDLGDFFALDFLGTEFERRRVFSTPFATSCAGCGSGPIVCNECGRPLSFVCELCGHRRFIHYEKRHLAAEGTCLYSPVPSAGIVLDGSRWRGTDFNAGFIVSSRVVDVLDKQSAHPFSFWPLRTWIGECDVERAKMIRGLGTSGRVSSRIGQS